MSIFKLAQADTKPEIHGPELAPVGRSWYRVGADYRGAPTFTECGDCFPWPTVEAAMGEEASGVCDELSGGYMSSREQILNWWFRDDLNLHPGARVLVEAEPPTYSSFMTDCGMEHDCDLNVAIIRVDHGRWTMERRLAAVLACLRRFDRFKRSREIEDLEKQARCRAKGKLFVRRSSGWSESWYCEMNPPDIHRASLFADDPKHPGGGIRLAGGPDCRDHGAALRALALDPEVSVRGLTVADLRKIVRY